MGVLLSKVLKVLKSYSSLTVCGVCMTRPTIFFFFHSLIPVHCDHRHLLTFLLEAESISLMKLLVSVLNCVVYCDMY